MAWYNWSQTAASNASADPTVNWAEGQAPSSINDSARAMMAATAKYRDDTAGALQATGSSSAYSVATNSVFDTLAHLKFQEISFVATATNAAGVTLNVDGLGALPIVGTDGVPAPAGTLIAGGVYTVLANSTEFILKGFYGNPYNIPIGGGMDYWATTLPNSNFAFPAGQQISQTTYATLYGLFGANKYGTDSGGLFFLPDKTGRVSAMIEASPSRLTSSYFGTTSTLLGSFGGGESQTLTLGQLPTGITSTNSGITLNNGGVAVTLSVSPTGVGGSSSIQGNAGGPTTSLGTNSVASSVTVSAQGISTSNNTDGNPHRTVQPTILCNYILRII